MHLRLTLGTESSNTPSWFTKGLSELKEWTTLSHSYNRDTSGVVTPTLPQTTRLFELLVFYVHFLPSTIVLKGGKKGRSRHTRKVYREEHPLLLRKLYNISNRPCFLSPRFWVSRRKQYIRRTGLDIKSRSSYLFVVGNRKRRNSFRLTQNTL